MKATELQQRAEVYEAALRAIIEVSAGFPGREACANIAHEALRAVEGK